MSSKPRTINLYIIRYWITKEIYTEHIRGPIKFYHTAGHAKSAITYNLNHIKRYGLSKLQPEYVHFWENAEVVECKVTIPEPEYTGWVST